MKKSAKKTVASKKKVSKSVSVSKPVNVAKASKVTVEKSGWCTKEFSLFLLRVSLGTLFLYAGITKLMDPTWSAEGFLQGAKTFQGMYSWFASPENIGWVNSLNSWGLTLIGAGLITGTLIRYTCAFGVLIMALYYFVGLDFPYVDHGFIVDDHVVYIFALLVLAKFNAGKYFGIDKLI